MTLLRYEPWWRMPDAPKRSRARRRWSGAALSFAGYWIVALAAAYAVHVEWLPARQWLVASTSTSVTAPRARIGRTIQVPVMELPETAEPPAPPPPAFVPENDPDPFVVAEAEPEPEREPEPVLAPAPRVERKREATRSKARVTRERRKREPEPRVKRETAPPAAPPAGPPHVVERAPEPSSPLEPERKEPKRERHAARPSSGGGTSCEAAIGSYKESMRIGDRSTPPDISQARYAAVLNRGTYFQHCGVPDTTSIRICAAVQNGRAVGVTVSTNPPSGAVQRCIANAVRGLAFPSHPRMDVTTTVFE